jgi:rhodanese-related sulfurtransferase
MAGHITGAISIAFRPAFATWLGWLIPPGVHLYFVLGEEPLDAVASEALLVGHEAFGGVLRGGMPAWERAGLMGERHELVDAASAAELLRDGAVAVDVREPSETYEHLPGAVLAPLGRLEELRTSLPGGRPLVVYCGHGERSATGLSLLARAGLGPFYNLDGGIGAWEAASLPLARSEATP